jgi:alpha-1,3-mannosylglycoprotein beta-1,4-N-acetylglucosaminyltransferase C
LLAGYLTIGIPSTYRKVVGHRYLHVTLDSLLSSIPPSEVDNIIIMVFIADVDADKRHTLTQALVSHYPDQLNSGLLQVVTVNASVYPPLENLKYNYGDPAERVKWRSKQVMDFAYMFHYGAPLSQYYIQIEDDVITAPNFVTSIRTVYCQANIVDCARILRTRLHRYATAKLFATCVAKFWFEVCNA